MRFLLAFILLSFPSVSFAQAHIAYCDMAASTAALQKCVKKHNDSAQARLNKTYEELTAEVQDDEASLEKLRELQQTWIMYRDNECAWESSRVETESLVKIYELSCKTRMTEDRADLLEATYKNEDAEEQGELSGFPRWMNVLSDDYPDVFWQFGERVRVDLNCDDNEDVVMLGTAVSRIKTLEASDAEMDKDQPGRTPHALDIVVAVTESPPTGRPKGQVFRLPVTETLDGPGLCSYKANLKVLEMPVKDVGEGETPGEEDLSCSSKVEISAKNCAPVLLSWSGKDFTLSTPEAPEDVQN